ncbi:lactonase family protein [Flavivirga rizhaonensis]|uniref:lactonase family protein n=1 Tax=Flavivirga rizhaonensis TaxID=2559571 RepID=UPI0014769070
MLYKLKSKNAAYIALNEEKNLLYSFQEVTKEKNPKLCTYSIIDGQFKLINEQVISGGLPCHLLKIEDRDLLVVACYQTGSVLVYPLDRNGIPKSASQEIIHVGFSINALRQESAHAHMISYNIHDGLIYVPDLGMDKIMVYKITDNNQLQENHQIEIPKGGGPRHMVFHPSNHYAFVMNELTGAVSLLKNNNGKFAWIQNTSSLSIDHFGEASSSAIKISKTGRFIYCGNRSNHTISILEFDEETRVLKFVGSQSTFGKTPRDFTLSPSGNWLLVANQDSDTIVVFAINEQAGLLNKAQENKESKSISCLKF